MPDILKLRATLGLNKKEYEDGLREAESEATGFGGKLGGMLGGAAKGFAVIGAAAAGAATAVGAIAKQAVNSYGETQQLVGGIETLFGKENLQTVIANADKAFQTAGMSANQYMETSIQSAAALINSLGGDQKKAAELMDMSVIDMADNVNKMGTSMEGVQNAYRGFSRGNFTMLDNLALGFAGTKEGMQELLEKAKEIDGYDYDINKYSDIVKAIHTVQQSMGISGTTASEAAGTITGSVGSVKAAWENLVAGLANPKADLGTLIDQVVQSGKVALTNLVPVFKQALKGVATLLKEVAPIISEELPGLINDVLPPLIEAASTLIVALVQNLPQIITVLLDAIPGLMKSVGKALKDAWPEVQKALMDALGTTSGKIIAVVLGIVTAIKGLGIIGGISNLVTAIGTIGPVITALANPVTLIVGAVAAAAVAIVANWDKIKAAWGNAKEFFGKVWEGIKGKFKDAPKWFADKFKSAWDGVKKAWNGAARWFTDVKNKILGAFTSLPASFINIGKNLIKGIGSGITGALGGVIETAKNAGKSILGAVKGFFGIHSPSKVFAEIGKFMMEGMANGIVDGLGVVNDAMDEVGNAVYTEAPIEDLSTMTSASTTTTPGEIIDVPRQSEPKNMTVILQLDRMQLGRAVYRLNNEEMQRVGVQLAGGYA